MPAAHFTASDLMDLLCQKVGLPTELRTEDHGVYFTDLDLDSLAFLQVQAELKKQFGAELPSESPTGYTIGDIVAVVQAAPSAEAAA